MRRPAPATVRWLILLAVLVLWEVLPRTGLIAELFLPPLSKTVTVLIERHVKHPVIGKMILRTKKYHAHVEANQAKTGDLVQIEECAPISKTKAWRVSQVLVPALEVRVLEKNS